jgi:membrane protease YdiL (CAAX protease family)
MDVAQNALALFVVVLLPLLGRGKMTALRRNPGEMQRKAVYRHGVLSLWAATGAALALGHGWHLLLVRAPSVQAWLDGHRHFAGAAVLVVCFFFLVTTGQGLACVRSAVRRRQVAPAFARLRFLLPVSRAERRWWIVLSLTAGICEELLYRGYLLAFLLGQFHGGVHLGVPVAWGLSALAFGLAHLYQGWRGMLASTAMGLVFGLLAIGTGSLFLPMALHAIIDLQVLWMVRPDLDRESWICSAEDTKNFRA